MAQVSNLTNLAGGAAPGAVSELPLRASFALDNMQRICASMFEMTLVPKGPPAAFDPRSLVFGACISLIGESGSLELALFGDEPSCSSLARVFFAMDEEQHPAPDEIVDAMGELINMVSGATKTRLDQTEHQKLTIGVPIFHTSPADCQKYQTKVIPLISQPVSSEQLEGTLYLVWSERTPVVLLEEAKACLSDRDDKLALGNGLAALHELNEILADTAAAENVAAIALCQRILTDVINERGQESIGYVVSIINALIEALNEDWLLPLQLPARPVESSPTDSDNARALVPVTRDDETLEMLGEFLSESQEGLEKCDELLMQIESGQGSSESIAALFRQFHTIKGIASFHELSDIERLAHSTENLLSEARDGKRALEGVALDLVFESTAIMARCMAAVRQSVESGLTFPESKAARGLTEKLAALLRGEVVETKGSGRRASLSPAAEAESKAVIKETVKIDIDELNELDALLPEFSAVLEQLGPAKDESSELARQRFAELLKQTEALSARMRMVPLRGLFQKMTRMARDLTKKTEKLARIDLEGEDTRVNRNVVEKLNGPLVHMIRNAIDHGLENAEERRATGKPLMGSIRLAARAEGQKVVVEIADDGKGLNAEAILAKARAKGLVPAEARPDDQTLFGLIFEPGFSTAAQVTALSGRGVGMDVVRREIESLKGHIEIDSKSGQGSRFRIVLGQSN